MSKRKQVTSRQKQAGLTLIELMVAMGLGLIVIVIAVAALQMGQQGYNTVDATTQLRDRERFAVDLLTRVVVQAGFQDFGADNLVLRSTAGNPNNSPEPDIYGWNNAVYATPSGLNLSQISSITNSNRPGSSGYGSDVLVVRFQGVGKTPGSLIADSSIINCAGQGERGSVLGDLNERAVSIFHLKQSVSGDPSLYCSYYDRTTTQWVNTPLIEGVEAFQVLYGTDGVTPGTVPSNTAPMNTVSERWLRADQLTVPGSFVGTRENWRRVRAVRLGLVLRAPVGSAQQRVTQPFYPLGDLYDSAADVGSFITTPADGRLRMQTAITVQLRNDQTLR